MPVRHGGAALLMSLPVFAWLFYWSAFWHHLWGGGSRRRGCIPKLQQKTSLSSSLSPSVIWALIYVLLWQRLTSFLTGSAHVGTLGGNNKSPGLPSRWAPWRVACVRRSSPIPPTASPELRICLPIAASLFLSNPHPWPTSRLWWEWQAKLCLSAGDRRAHPFCLCKCVHASARVPEAKRSAQCLLWWQKNQSVDSTHLCILLVSHEREGQESWAGREEGNCVTNIY